MTASTSTRTTAVRLVAPLTLLLALAGCSTATGAGASPSATKTATASAAPCADVTVVVNFGTLGHDALTACAPAGTAAEVLKAAHIATAGTADYGDSVICRVDELPSPAAESCAKLPASAYWAMWVKPAGGKWDYAQAGVQTEALTAGQALGLVYTVGSDSTPPQG